MFKKSYTSLKCSPNETSSQQEVTFLSYELLKTLACSPFVVILIFYLVFTMFLRYINLPYKLSADFDKIDPP